MAHAMSVVRMQVVNAQKDFQRPSERLLQWIRMPMSATVGVTLESLILDIQIAQIVLSMTIDLLCHIVVPCFFDISAT